MPPTTCEAGEALELENGGETCEVCLSHRFYTDGVPGRLQGPRMQKPLRTDVISLNVFHGCSFLQDLLPPPTREAGEALEMEAGEACAMGLIP